FRRPRAGSVEYPVRRSPRVGPRGLRCSLPERPMSTFPHAVQDFIATLRHGPDEQMGARFAEVMTAIEHAGPEEASWALLAVVELLAAPRRPFPGCLAAVAGRCLGHGASPWVATGLIVERLCGALAAGGGPRGDPDLLAAAAAPLLGYFAEARQLFYTL